MTDHDTIEPTADDELRARLRAFGREVADRAEVEAALEAVPRPTRRSATRMLALAACLLVAVALAAALRRELVAGTDPAATPPEECLETTQEPTTPGGPVNTRLATQVAVATTAIALLGACDDDGPETLAEGDVELVGGSGLGGQHIVISAEEDDGVVTGEIRYNDTGDPSQLVIVTVDCARTDVDGFLILGGIGTGPEGGEYVGRRSALAIRDGEPPRLALYGREDGSGECEEVVDEITDEELRNPHPDNSAEVESGELELG